jgi:hypothetical protein
MPPKKKSTSTASKKPAASVSTDDEIVDNKKVMKDRIFHAIRSRDSEVLEHFVKKLQDVVAGALSGLKLKKTDELFYAIEGLDFAKYLLRTSFEMGFRRRAKRTSNGKEDSK